MPQAGKSQGMVHEALAPLADATGEIARCRVRRQCIDDPKHLAAEGVELAELMARASSLTRYALDASFAKRKSDDHLRVEQLVAKMERSVRQAFLTFVQNVRSQVVMREVAELLGRSDVESALKIVDRYVVRMAPVVSSVFIASANDETKALAEQVNRISPAVGISFDPTYQRAADLMADAQLNFIQDFTATQREAVRTALTQALIDGEGPIGTAAAFRNAIGLTARQLAAIQNYRNLLAQGSSEALDRDIRDRRFDRTVQRAVNTGEPLSTKQVDAMVDRYRDRYLMSRAETIARTETGNVVSQARDEAFKQVAAEANITSDMVERTWRATRDSRTRDSHAAMNGQKVEGTEEAFISGAGNRLMRPHDPAAPASEVINCRCVQTLKIKRRTP
ncbi:phage minor head protein [Mesorhizobium sp. M4A.F.Ca.ET.090.04.2.1]|uniref:phage minor head protein n=1 Tax=Mesorhizobium sp. M4A.F.Ca.ET.090.04.2.1 TaxID=2496663 RepID=UPI0016753C15|nr:phage minor head protein [Mesorhizobium sp. M4A.F.Ca.ET.090.04.2.1]